MRRQRYEWYEADCEEREFGFDMRCDVATVVALYNDSFVSFQLRSEVVSADCETESHWKMRKDSMRYWVLVVCRSMSLVDDVRVS